MVSEKICNTYQAYCHTYKPHAIATCHGGPAQPTDRDIPAHKTTDTNTEQAQELHQVNGNDFKVSEPNNPARLTLITRELDDLWQCVPAGEGQPMEALHHIECKLKN